VLDLAGTTLLPGMIDGHCYLIQRQQPVAQSGRHRLDVAVLAVQAIGTAQNALANGITTLADHGSPDGVVLQVRNAISDESVTGPRLVTCGQALTTTAGFGDADGEITRADSADELRVKARRWIARGADFIKVIIDGPGAVARPQYTADEVQALVNDVHRMGSHVIARAEGTEAIRLAIDAGVDVITPAGWRGATDDTLEFDLALARRGAGQGTIIEAPLTETLVPYRSVRVRGWTDTLAPRFPWDLTNAVRKAGCRASLTSAATSSRVAKLPHDVQQLSRDTGLAPMEAIQMLTSVPAAGLGLAGVVGTLAPGAIADVIAVEGDPSLDLGALTRVSYVIRGGRVVVRDGLLLPAADW